MGRRCQNCHDGRKASLEVISQLGSSVFLSQKISQQDQPKRTGSRFFYLYPTNKLNLIVYRIFFFSPRPFSFLLLLSIIE
jgi:hypothetical protein